MKRIEQPSGTRMMDSIRVRASISIMAIGILLLAGTLPGAPGVVCAVLLDDFNRANGQIGDNWSGATSAGNYQIIDNEVAVLGGGPIYWDPESFGPSQSACITLDYIADIYKHGILLKVQGADPDWTQGAILVFYEDSTEEVGIRTYVPGQGWTLLALFDIPLSDGDQLGAVALPDGVAQAYVNGVLIGTADTGPFFADTGGAIGLWFSSAASDLKSSRNPRGEPNARLDDFRGGDF